MPRIPLATTLLAIACLVPSVRMHAADETVAPPANQAADSELRLQASYLVGRNAGQAVGRYGFDLEQLIAGLRDAVEGKASKVDETKAEEILNKFQQLQKAQEANAGEKRKTENPKWLEGNGKKAGITTTASGLQYEVLAKGLGKSPVKGEQVLVNYTGKLLDGTVFDASERHGGPATFGVGQVIEGWNEALQLMKEGDKWRLYIPSDLAYGENGPPNIGPNQILIFDVELVKVSPQGAEAGPSIGPDAPKSGQAPGHEGHNHP